MNTLSPSMHLMSPWITRGVYATIKVFVPPQLVSRMSSVKLLMKHIGALGFENMFSLVSTSETINEELYYRNLIKAESLEQRERLYRALDETVPLEEKDEDELKIWEAAVEEKRPLYLNIHPSWPVLDTPSFLPIVPA